MILLLDVWYFYYVRILVSRYAFLRPSSYVLLLQKIRSTRLNKIWKHLCHSPCGNMEVSCARIFAYSSAHYSCTITHYYYNSTTRWCTFRLTPKCTSSDPRKSSVDAIFAKIRSRNLVEMESSYRMHRFDTVGVGWSEIWGRAKVWTLSDDWEAWALVKLLMWTRFPLPSQGS